MNDNDHPPISPAGVAGNRRDEPPVYGEPKGPRPPVMTTVDKPARDIEATTKVISPFASNSPTGQPTAHHATCNNVAIHGFHGGVEHPREIEAARKREASGD